MSLNRSCDKALNAVLALVIAAAVSLLLLIVYHICAMLIAAVGWPLFFVFTGLFVALTSSIYFYINMCD